MRSLGVDLALWRAAASFRRLYVAGFVTALGGQATYVTDPLWKLLHKGSIPLEVRGRMAGIELISYSIGPTGGQFRAGLMVRRVRLRASLSLGGLACTDSVVAEGAGLRSLWRLDARHDVHVAALRASRAASLD